ncbi:hypothetical protein GYA49_04990 [Candidatus Beckwithbacteria bacterium]|nr:hypothetical protein [Candidatus Beckwithbacteria bacterium]
MGVEIKFEDCLIAIDDQGVVDALCVLLKPTDRNNIVADRERRLYAARIIDEFTLQQPGEIGQAISQYLAGDTSLCPRSTRLDPNRIDQRHESHTYPIHPGSPGAGTGSQRKSNYRY